MDAVTALSAQVLSMQNAIVTELSKLQLGHHQAPVNMNQNNQQHVKSGNMSVEDMLKQIMADQATMAADQAKMAADIRQGQLAQQNLEKQIGQLASTQGSRTQVNAVSTRSGLQSPELSPKSRVGNGKEDEVPVEVFDVYKALKLPAVYEELSAVTVLDEEVTIKQVTARDPLERVLMGQDDESDAEAKALNSVLDMPNFSMLKKQAEPLNRVLGPSPKPSIMEAPKVDLKPLPSHLRYVFLRANDTLPVIFSSALSDVQVIAALDVLKRHKKAIGWQMTDLHGISPVQC